LTSPFNTYYVYIHVDPETKEVLYVGMGKGSRAYATKTTKTKQAAYGHRSPEHSEHLDRLLDKGYLPHEWIIFINRGLIKEEALHIEKQLISSLKPLYNKSHGILNLLFDQTGVDRIKNLREQGLSYQKIAIEVGCSTMVAYRILNNKSPRYKEMMND